MVTVTIEEAQADLECLMDALASGIKDEVIITIDAKPAVRMVMAERLA